MVKAVEADDEKEVKELLRPGTKSLEPDCIYRAFLAATRRDSHINLIELFASGHAHLDECLKIAIEEKKPNSRAILLLVYAALRNKVSIVRTLYEKVNGDHEQGFPPELIGEDLADVQKAIVEKKISTVVAIKFASAQNSSAALEELLMNTKVNQEKRFINWSNLELKAVDPSVFRKIDWVRKLRLESNMLQEIPPEVKLLSQVSIRYYFTAILL